MARVRTYALVALQYINDWQGQAVMLSPQTRTIAPMRSYISMPVREQHAKGDKYNCCLLVSFSSNCDKRDITPRKSQTNYPCLWWSVYWEFVLINYRQDREKERVDHRVQSLGLTHLHTSRLTNEKLRNFAHGINGHESGGWIGKLNFLVSLLYMAPTHRVKDSVGK